jgi:hypothetical protein
MDLFDDGIDFQKLQHSGSGEADYRAIVANPNHDITTARQITRAFGNELRFARCATFTSWASAPASKERAAARS